MNVIGVDIGGTGVKGAIINRKAEILQEVKVSTNIAEGREGILRSVVTVIDSLFRNNIPVSGIGVGSAGRINPEKGEVVFATANLPNWEGTKLKAFLEKKYEVESYIENDANTALLGEMWAGATYNKQLETAVMLTLGTGVGGATAINGKILNGSKFQSGEWGHVILVPHGKPCNCGKDGCIEQYLSGTALTQAVRTETELAFTHGAEIFEAYSNGNKQVKKVVDRYIDYLTIVIYNITVAIDPQAILIGGGLIESQAHWWNELEKKLKNMDVNTAVIPALLGNKAGMFGAAAMALQHIEKRGESV
ncbi:ROK family protein [Sutcliffiella horikoshii]|uniref:ROK family protein n=1 Tax=Sutcliffiella horikoshii TaxID=79883 RepID=A0A5D4T6I8_9BACI|nr:ROK family protein [Sutcliffiella horikoshii]TYS69816.1 ROK family protein [Sutcliffiella horikoshii]